MKQLKQLRKLIVASFLLLLVFQTCAIFANEQPKTVTDLTKAYEVWKNQGIKFVVRDKGKFVSWATGRLESWKGESRWVVRNTKGHFLTHAKGKVETWKNGKTRLVIRDQKGRLLTHVGIDISARSSFAANVVGLRKLEDKQFLAFVQGLISDLLVEDLSKGELTKVRVLTTYLGKYHDQGGTSNFKPILRKIAPQLNFMANNEPDNKRLQETAANVRDMIKML